MNNFQNSISEIDSLLDEGLIDMAVRLSAELLAATDSQWTALRNEKRPTEEALLHGSIAGSRHVESLMMAGQTNEAYATALMLLLKEVIDGSAPKGIESARLVIIYLAVRALMTLAESIDPSDNESAGHASAILTELGSMLYEAYRHLHESGSNHPYMQPVYESLKELREIGAIQYPAVEVNGETVQISDHRTLIGDIIGRSRAMGWFICD